MAVVKYFYRCFDLALMKDRLSTGIRALDHAVGKKITVFNFRTDFNDCRESLSTSRSLSVHNLVLWSYCRPVPISS
jgi:hypothetical protein